MYGGDEVERYGTRCSTCPETETDHCTAEALDAPFLLLPFRPDSNSSETRGFIRNFFKYNSEGSSQYRGQALQQELRLTEPVVLCSIIKWCWSRIPNGVVTWPVYEGFQTGEQESNMARNAFNTFIPISVDSAARKNIIFDFFDLLAAVAAHGKMNGLGGRKVSRLAGWWAFEHSDDGKGFEGGYKSWRNAADASSHLFFAYLRSLSPEADPSMSLIERIPRSLQALLASTEYPPETHTMLQRSTPRVVMLVDSVSPTPFALLRRAKHFEYRDNDRVLRQYSEFEDPVDALTDECKRVLYAISSTNSSAARSRHRNATKTGESWSAFSNLGFSDMDEKALQKTPNVNGFTAKPRGQGLRSEPRSRNADHGRPTTPSWADFLSSGFHEDDMNKTSTTLLLPPDKVLPLISSRAQTPSHMLEGDETVAPGELAAITNVDLDDAFWWVWMTSLAGEEPAERKAVFGRCALIETSIMNGRWLIMEEQVKGASPDPVEGAYVVQKKSFFSTFKKGGKLGRKRSTGKKPTPPPHEPLERATSATPSKSSLAPDQQSKIKQAAAALKKQDSKDDESTIRRGRYDDAYSTKTNSMLTMGLQSEAGPAMKWMGAYDKNTIRAHYLGDSFAGRGMSRENSLFLPTSSVNFNGDGASTVSGAPAPVLNPEATKIQAGMSNRDLPALPQEEDAVGTPGLEPETQQSASAAWASMPPSEPGANALPADAAEKQHEAEAVPIPEVAPPGPSSAMDKELAVNAPSSPKLNRLGRKPVPRTDDHPAFRGRSDGDNALQTPTSPTQNAAVIAAQRAMAGETSPESTKGGHNRLKKHGGAASGGGLKKLFGRKKDNPSRQSVDVSQQQQQPKTNNLAPPDQGVGRRISLMRKKPSTPKDSQVNVPKFTEHPNASELEAEPVMPASHGQFENSETNISHVDSIQEHQNAEKEFARFDQGPVDMPALTPEDSEPEIAAPQAQRAYNPRMASNLAPESGNDSFVTPMERGDPMANDDAEPEPTTEEPEDVRDRWAIIRENAARRAARANKVPASEEQEQEQEQETQSRPSQSQRTDDGETSGEESKSTPI